MLKEMNERQGDSARSAGSELCPFLWDTGHISYIDQVEALTPASQGCWEGGAAKHSEDGPSQDTAAALRTVCKEEPLGLPSGPREDQHLPFLSAFPPQRWPERDP